MADKVLVLLCLVFCGGCGRSPSYFGKVVRIPNDRKVVLGYGGAYAEGAFLASGRGVTYVVPAVTLGRLDEFSTVEPNCMGWFNGRFVYGSFRDGPPFVVRDARGHELEMGEFSPVVAPMMKRHINVAGMVVGRNDDSLAVFSLPDGKMIDRFPLPERVGKYSLAVDLSNNGAVAAWAYDRRVFWAKVGSGVSTELQGIKLTFAKCVALSPDGETLVVGGIAGRKGKAVVRSLPDSEEICRQVMEEGISAASVGPNGVKVFLGGRLGSIMCLSSGRIVDVIQAPVGTVDALVEFPQEKRLLAAGSTGSVMIDLNK